MISRIARLVYTFYTFRAMILHLGYIGGILPNTSIIAIVVLIGSQVMFWIYPCYIKRYHARENFISEFFLHWVPFLLFLFADDVHVTRRSVILLIMTLGVYVLAQGGRQGLQRIYRDNVLTRNSIMHPSR